MEETPANVSHSYKTRRNLRAGGVSPDVELLVACGILVHGTKKKKKRICDGNGSESDATNGLFRYIVAEDPEKT